MIRTPWLHLFLLLLVASSALADEVACPVDVPLPLGGRGATNVTVAISRQCCNEIHTIPQQDKCSAFLNDMDKSGTHCTTRIAERGLQETTCYYDLRALDPHQCVEDTKLMCSSPAARIIWHNFTIQCRDTTSITTNIYYQPSCVGAACSRDEIEAYLWASHPTDPSVCTVQINGKTRWRHQHPGGIAWYIYASLVVAAVLGVGVAFMAPVWKKHSVPEHELQELAFQARETYNEEDIYKRGITA